MNIESIMSKDLIVCNINDAIHSVAKRMHENDVGIVPIVDNKKIIGIITDRDIVVNAISNNVDSNADVGKYMTRNIVTIDKDQSIEDAIELMGHQKIKRLLVTDDEKVVGILSLSDLINTDLDNEMITNNLKKIWEIFRNTDKYKTEVDEFYL